MSKHTTIKDIAKTLNIHHSTVSRALRNRPDVKADTRRLVLETAKKLDYQPNALAQNLKKQRTNSIGVIVPEIKHNFFAAFISGVEDIAYNKGYVILLSQSNEDMEREVLNTRALVSNHVAGLIVSISQTTDNSDHFKLFLDRGGALVFFDRICPELDTSKVTVDDYAGAFKATEHLIKRGYRKIGHLGGTRKISITEARYEGFLAALQKYNIKINKSYIQFHGFHEINGKEGMKSLLGLTDRPEAIFAINDPVALGAYEAIKEQGLKIPQDMAIVGFSNNPSSAVVSPALTTINQPAYEMGQKSAELLIEQIENGKEEYVVKHEILNTNLIVRQST